jgi:iron complex outermembrane receptor protein
MARWGGAVGEDTHARIYALLVDRDNTVRASGAEVPDASERRQAGFRADWSSGARTLTVQGDVYRGGDAPANNLAPQIHGGNLLARWGSRLADGSSYKVQASYDLASRDDANLFRNHARTLDLQFTHEPKVAAGQLLWGAGHRETNDVNQPTANVLFVPSERTLTWSNVFAQYQWKLAEALQATVGAKLERNSYTGTEVLPSLRLAWEHSPRATTWAAVSRAVRAPSRIDRDFFFPGRAPFVIAGGPNFQSEVATVYEVGHRAQVSPTLSYSATLFRQAYRGLRSGVPGVVPATVENLVDGSIDGLETWGHWQATRGWRLSGGYLALHQHLRFADGLSPTTTSFPGLGNDPRYQWMLRSSLDLGASEFDVIARRVGQLPAPAVPGYTAVDASWGLQVSPALRLAVAVRNLFDPGHREFNAPAAASEIDRRWLFTATWQL